VHCAKLLQKLPEPIKAFQGFRAVKIFLFICNNTLKDQRVTPAPL